MRLTENYRSTPEILAAALPVAEAIDGAPRRMETHSPHGAEVRLLTAEGDRAEAIFVAKEIARMVGGIGMLEAQALGPPGARGASGTSRCSTVPGGRRPCWRSVWPTTASPAWSPAGRIFCWTGRCRPRWPGWRGSRGGKVPAALLEEWTAHHTLWRGGAAA